MDDLKKRRFKAGFIDLFCIPFLIFFVIGTLHKAQPPLSVTILISTLWLVIRDLFDGAGPGKRLCKLKVIKKSTGEALDKKDFFIGLVRNIMLAIPFFYLFFKFISFNLKHIKKFNGFVFLSI